MQVTLSFEKSSCRDVAVVVDVLRASSTITVALDYFNQVYAVKDKQTAIELAKKHGAVLAGERKGAKIESFDTGNSPVEIKNFHGQSLVLTTSNGTRILEGIKAKTLIGSFINARAVAKAASKNAEDHIDILMAGVNGRFAIEDFLGAGEIISNLRDKDLDEMALSAYMASRDEELVKEAVMNSQSASGLKKLGYNEDISFCIKKDLYQIVPFYQKGIIQRMI